jgi:uncharacterized phage protein gp47/JayE
MPTPGRELLAAVRTSLEAVTAADVAVWVGGPGWIEVTVTAEVVPRELSAAAAVEASVRAAVAAYLDPVCGREGAGWPLGENVVDAELMAVVQRVDGVHHVRRLTVDTRQRVSPPVEGAWLPFGGTHEFLMVGGG